jgi:hypothetical protein
MLLEGATEAGRFPTSKLLSLPLPNLPLILHGTTELSGFSTPIIHSLNYLPVY